MLALTAAAAEISRTDIPVLILGESGTGKDAYARLIHRLSQKAELNFWKINCSTVDPGELLAQLQKATGGLLNQESSGSIYLDNIQELDLACQRVLPSQLPDGEGAGVGDFFQPVSSPLQRRVSNPKLRGAASAVNSIFD